MRFIIVLPLAALLSFGATSSFAQAATNKASTEQSLCKADPAETTHVSLAKDSSTFKARDGSIIIEGRFNSKSYYSPDGKRFFELRQTQYGGTDSRHATRFVNPNLDAIEHTWWRDRDLLVLDGERIGLKKYPFSAFGNDDDKGKPLITMNGTNFVLDDAALTRHGLTAENVLQNKDGAIRFFEPELVFSGKEFAKVESLLEIDATKLPTVRRPEYLFKLSDGKFLYVSADKFNYSYASLRMYIGTPGAMQEARIVKFERFKDGGTTEIETQAGTLHKPSAFNQQVKPTWNGSEIVSVDPRQFEISETQNCFSFAVK